MSAASPARQTGSTSESGLAANSLGSVQIAVMAVAASGPAASVALLLPSMAGFAGKAMTFAFIATTVVVALLTSTFTEFSKRISSAGSLLAWSSAGLGPSVGFVFGWCYLGGYFLVTATGLAAFGGFAHNLLAERAGVGIPWWSLTLACAAYVVVLAWRGIGQTVKSALALLGLEVGVVLALCVTLVVAGDVPLEAAPFRPGTAPGGWTGIGLAITFGVLSLVGYEEAATFSEEAKDPRRSIGRGLWMAGLGVPLFFLVVSYVLTTSYGSMDEFVQDPLAVETLANRVWHGAAIAIPLVVILSCLAFTQTAFNAGVRVLYSLARAGVIPARLAGTHRAHKTPTASITLFTVVVLPLTLIPSAFVGPIDVFGYLAFMVAIFFLLMYGTTNIALVRYVRVHDRPAFSVLRHAILPAAALAGVLYPLYRQLYPLPAAPFPALLLVVVAWIAIGTVLLTYLRRSRRAGVDEAARAFAATDSG